MSHFLLNLARRAAGLVPVARIGPTPPVPPFEVKAVELEEDTPAAAPVPKSPSPMQPDRPAEVNLEDLLRRLRRQIGVGAEPSEAASERPLPRTGTTKEARSTDSLIERSRPAASEPAQPTARLTPTVAPPVESKGKAPVASPLPPSPATPREEKVSPESPRPTPKGPPPPRTPLRQVAAAPPSLPEKTTLIEVVKVVPAPVSPVPPAPSQMSAPVAPPLAPPGIEAKRGRAPTPEKPRQGVKTPQPVPPPATILDVSKPRLDAAKPVRKDENRSEYRAAEAQRPPPVTSPWPKWDERRSRPLPMPKPPPEKRLAQEPTRAVQNKVSSAPPPVEVRIGTLEVRGSPTTPPAPRATSIPSPRREGFDSYRSVRDYSGWFRG